MEQDLTLSKLKNCIRKIPLKEAIIRLLVWYYIYCSSICSLSFSQLYYTIKSSLYLKAKVYGIRVEDSKLYLFPFFSSFLFSFSFPDLRLGISVTLHNMTLYHIYITCHSHIIICHIEKCRRFWNNDIMPYVNSIQYTCSLGQTRFSVAQTISLVYIKQTLCT